MSLTSAPPGERAPEDGEPPAISAVVVHWRGEEDLRRLLASWPEDPRFELVVLDNGSLEPLPELPASARLVRAGRNLGFAGGANLGFAVARGDLLLLLNPDACPEPGALETLLAGFAQQPEVAGLAPRLRGADGESQHTWQLRPLPTPRQLLLQAFFVDSVQGPAEEPSEGSPVAQPAAAALALRRRALEAVGGLDPRFHPAWFEDVDLAHRLAGKGLEVRYWPRAELSHEKGSTVSSLGFRGFLWAYYRNLERYLARHHGRRWSLPARLLLVPGMLLRLTLLPLRRVRRASSRREAAAALLATAVGAATGWRLARPLISHHRTLSTSRPVAAGTARNPAPIDGPGRADQEYAVLMVTHDSASDVPGAMSAIAALEPLPRELVVVDCASGDDTLEIVRVTWPVGLPGKIVPLEENLGFAGGMNRALAESRAPWALLLNPDARPQRDYVDRLLELAEKHPVLPVAAITGRLVRPVTPGQEPCLDACGMRLLPTWRHLDRGSGEPDRGQLDRPERVFGATGAASLFRRQALEDVAVGGEAFDSRFHSFREDAELCFRLRERGWEVLYQPRAVCEHRRRVTPARRAELPAPLNYHSLKNRYLLRAYHQTWWNFLWTLPATALRDLLALAWVLARERTSLPAYRWLWRHRREILERRRMIRLRCTEPGRRLDRWFLRRGAPL
jgi:GT2 family glycosyltransferase